jgi:membrane fusion protein (multidrug efflux system)
VSNVFVHIRRFRPRALLLIAALVAPLAACKKDPAPPTPPPPEVGVISVEPAAIPTSYEFTAEVQPYRRIEVRARVEGIIEARTFEEGQQVSKGQVLYRVDRVRTEAAYQAALARAENAQRTLARLEPLFSANAVAAQDVDDARAELRLAQAALAQARKDRNDTVIRAEINGRIGRALLDVGARVTGPAELLTTIDVVDPVYVSFRPSTQQLLAWRQDSAASGLLRPGGALEVQVVLPDGTTLPRTARLDYVAPSLDPGTGTQEFRARFENPDRLLLPGQFVRARLQGFVHHNALAVPQAAVQQALGRQFVYVVGPGDSVVARDVQPGEWSGTRWIITQGLAAGERVVVDGLQKVRAGAVVRPVLIEDTVSQAALGVQPAPQGGTR